MGANTIPADREQNRVTYPGGGSTVADKDSPESTGQGIDMGPTMYDEAASWHVQPAAAEAAKLAAAKKNRYYALLYREMADRRQAEAQLCVNYGLLSSLNQAQIRFLSGAELSAVFQDLLNALLEITESSFGFIGDIVRIEGGPPSVDMLAHVIPKAFSIDGPALDDLALVVLQKASPDQPVIRSGSFPEFSANGDSVQEAVAALLDTYSFLGLSLYGGDETVGVLALGNRAAGYDAEMVDLLRPVQSACAQMILAKRSDEERTLAERALSEERASLAQRVAERTAELRAVNTELEFAVRAKDEFLAMVNHELRTPLNAVLLMTEVLQKGIYGALQEKQQRAVRDIAESGRHLLSLISDILDVSKMDAGKMDLDIGPCEVASVCRSSLQLVQGMAQKSDIQVSLEIADDVEIVHADSRRLKQMLVNLLSNAVKFTPAEGSVGLQVSGDADANVVRFTVWDTGIGIAENDMEKLFQPFVQLDTGNTRQYGGTGLGLVLVARMAKMQDGDISVESQVDQGSRFTITLPWHREDVADTFVELHCPYEERSFRPLPDALSTPMHRRPPISEPKEAWNVNGEQESEQEDPLILIADDNMPNVDALSEYLSIHQCRLAVAHGGLDAVDKARRLRPQLILMDIQMPDLDGIEATRQIRASEGLDRVPIVALTATVMPGDKERCLDAGMTDFLGKPVDPERLDTVIHRLTGCARRPLPVQAAT